MISAPKTDWIVEVYVTLKPSVLDPQGSAIQTALHSMGYTDLIDTRLGKFFTLHFAGKLKQPLVEHQLKQMCDKLLANPVIERYHFRIVSGPGCPA